MTKLSSWQKFALYGAGIGGVIFAGYEIINGWFKVPPPPNETVLLNEKNQLFNTYLTSYNNYTQNGTVAMTQAQINSLNSVSNMMQIIQKEIQKGYQSQLNAIDAMINALSGGLVDIVLGIAAIWGLTKVTKAALQAWLTKKKTPPKGGTPQSPADQLSAAINAFMSKTYNYTPIVYAETTIGVEMLAYAYQLQGMTSNAINILNNYIPIAEANYSDIQNQLVTLSGQYSGNAMSTDTYVNTVASYNVISASMINLLSQYSVEGFAIAVAALFDYMVDDAIMESLITILDSIEIIAGYFTISSLADAIVELAPVAAMGA